MSLKLKNNDIDYLFKAILNLKTMEECYNFFEDLCTVTEIKAMSQRMLVAKMLKEKRFYNDIIKTTGASSATISRVNRCLLYGENGYTTALERLQYTENREIRHDRVY